MCTFIARKKMEAAGFISTHDYCHFAASCFDHVVADSLQGIQNNQTNNSYYKCKCILQHISTKTFR